MMREGAKKGRKHNWYLIILTYLVPTQHHLTKYGMSAGNEIPQNMQVMHAIVAHSFTLCVKLWNFVQSEVGIIDKIGKN